MAEPKGFFRKLLKRPNLSLRRSTTTSDTLPEIAPNDTQAFDKVWLSVHVSLAVVYVLIAECTTDDNVDNAGCPCRTGREADPQGDREHARPRQTKVSTRSFDG